MQITTTYSNEDICKDIIRFYIEDSIHEKRQNTLEPKQARLIEKHRDKRLIDFLEDLNQYSLLPMRVDTIETAINNQPDGDYFVAVVDARYSDNEFYNNHWEQIESFTLTPYDYESIQNAYDESSILPLKAILFQQR